METIVVIEGIFILFLLWSNHDIKKALTTLGRSVQNMADLADKELDGLKFRVEDLESEINDNHE